MNETKTVKKQGRQGDVLVLRVNEVPGKLVKTRSHTLANGEATGHAHVLEGESIERWAEKDTDEVEYFTVPTNRVGTQVHEEHGRLNYDRGTYRSIRQTEYTPEELRKVRD